MNKKWIMAAMGTALAFSLAACGGSEESSSSSGSTTASTDQTASAGDADKLYQQSCASCHGNNLQGQVGPSLKNVGGKYSQDEIENIILNGRGSMPQGILQGEDATKVASWLAEKK